MPQPRKQQQLVFVSLVLLLLLNYPLIHIFNRPVLVGGVPLLYLYLLVVWLAAIAATAWIIENRTSRKNKQP